MFRIQILNNISKIGLDQFKNDSYQVAEDIDKPDAILVRSHNLHHTQIAESVKIIARAGVGTNNIPVAKMTELGIPVLNTPGANANAVKELVITGMLLACRNICQAWNFSKQLTGDNAQIHEAVEQHKKQFAGFELPGKTLGVIGLGNIGVKVANAAINLGMHVVGYDPAITVKNAWQLSSSVVQAEKLEEVLNQSDFLTFHVPLNDATRHLINANRVRSMKNGVVLLNFARDGIIDNQTLNQALKEKKVSSYVCDFPNQLFQNNPQVISLPHLGASTKEAEDNCAVMVVQQVMSFLESGQIFNSVNFPAVKLASTEGYRLTIINRNVPNMVAQISSTLSQHNINIIDMINKSRDNIAYNIIDVNQPISQKILTGLAKIDGVIKARSV